MSNLRSVFLSLFQILVHRRLHLTDLPVVTVCPKQHFVRVKSQNPAVSQKQDFIRIPDARHAVCDQRRFSRAVLPDDRDLFSLVFYRKGNLVKNLLFTLRIPERKVLDFHFTEICPFSCPVKSRGIFDRQIREQIGHVQQRVIEQAGILDEPADPLDRMTMADV